MAAADAASGGSWVGAAPRFLELGVQLQMIEGVVPVLLEPAAQGSERGAARLVQTAATVARARDETHLVEHAQVLRDRAEGDVAERAVELPGGARLAPAQAEELAAARRGESVEHDQTI
jgi:hypothetical protein